MRKMSTGVPALFVAGLVGLACSGLSGLNSGGGGAGNGGGAKGGQAGSTVGSGTAGESGGTIASGGVAVGGSGGTTTTGGVTGAGGAKPIAGMTATGGTTGSGGCPLIACPAIACLGGYLPNPDPCGCPICGPTFDGGVGKDAGRADTLPTACPMLASLNSTDTALFGYSAKRMLLECTGGGVTEICTSNDATGCPGPGSTPGGGIGCSNLCTSGEYGLSYGGVGPLAPPPSIALPAGCGQGVYTPGGVAYYCCPCGM